MTLLGHVGELWRYPVSSMGGERLDRAEIGTGGVAGDRVWGVVDTRDGTVAGPEKRRHWRPLPNLFSRQGEAGPEIGRGDGDWLPVTSREAADLVSTFLGFPVALKSHGGEGAGTVEPRYARADLHVLTTASMDELGRLLGNPSEIDARRFRPNVVVTTLPEFEGFADHGFVGQTLSIGGVRMSVSEPCARCAFTSLAQGDLTFEPAVLHRIAQHGDGGFGVLCTVETAGEIRLGDEVRLKAAGS